MTVKVPQPKIRTIVNKILHPISTDVNAIELVIGREDTIEISYKEPGAIQRSTNVAQVNPQRPSSHHWVEIYMKETWNCLLVTLQTMEQWINWAEDYKTERVTLTYFQRIRIQPAFWEAKLWEKFQSPNFLFMVSSTNIVFNFVSRIAITLTPLLRRNFCIAWCFKGKLKPQMFQEAITIGLDRKEPPRHGFLFC